MLLCQNISKSFKQPNNTILTILESISLEIDKNTSLSIRGASGSGKTTLLNILSSFDTPDSGTISYNSKSITSMKYKELLEYRAKDISFIFQNYNLISDLNLIENILISSRVLYKNKVPKETIEYSKYLLNRLNLNIPLNQSINKLSGGEKQRVAIARALINQPSIIFADEPTGNLDEEASNTTIDLLLDLVKEHNISLVLVTHNNKIAKLTDFQYILEHKTLIKL